MSMDSESGVGHTITDGIQDISALLPLLGTEQCEEHVGSALIDGYLYVAAAPLSIFGSLGIVRAGFKAFVASIKVGWGQEISMGGMGARILADAGFGPAGKALRLIMWDKDLPNERHAVETKLTATLEELHITDAKSLSVKAVSDGWNWQMLVASHIMLVVSIMPYVYFIKNNHGKPLYARWFFPLARSLGCLITANMTQFIIQARLLEIIRHRIAFSTLDRYIRAKQIPLDSEKLKWWDARFTSEIALRSLEAHLSNRDVENQEKMKELNEVLGKTMAEHELSLSLRTRIIFILARLGVVIGLGLSVAGYIGCFSLVKGGSTIGSYIWLSTEVFLSLVRMAIWAWNPKWDDNEAPLEISLQLSTHCPLPTCNKFSEELDEEEVLPLTRSREFLKAITSFVGLLDPVEGIQEGIALYYAMSWCGTLSMRVLYVVLHNYKEGISQMLVYQDQSTSSAAARPACRRARVDVVNGEKGVDWVQAKMTSMDGHHLPEDETLVGSLTKHCNSIFQKLHAAEEKGTGLNSVDDVNGTLGKRLRRLFRPSRSPALGYGTVAIRMTWELARKSRNSQVDGQSGGRSILKEGSDDRLFFKWECSNGASGSFSWRGASG
ncbi:hypothetical protein HGRIS_001693 [Hohenbuehelia grisea]|uniref:Uncharacterized protein n=1 Tax=Hohenbuehelia grisea TaxID=104357 RepID=A0ABR3JJX9_9AGAR